MSEEIDPNATPEEFKRKLQERVDLIARLKSLEAELSNPNLRIQGARASPHRYCNWKHQKITELKEIEKRLAEIKIWLRVHIHLQPLDRRKPKDPGRLDEFDLANHLSEPQQLLHRT